MSKAEKHRIMISNIFNNNDDDGKSIFVLVSMRSFR